MSTLIFFRTANQSVARDFNQIVESAILHLTAGQIGVAAGVKRSAYLELVTVHLPSWMYWALAISDAHMLEYVCWTSVAGSAAQIGL